jgi:hypothetical protein
VSIEPALSARQIGTFSLAGNQMKFSVNTVARATCSECPLDIIGHVENATFAEDGRTFTGGHFVARAPEE